MLKPDGQGLCVIYEGDFRTTCQLCSDQLLQKVHRIKLELMVNSEMQLNRNNNKYGDSTQFGNQYRNQN